MRLVLRQALRVVRRPVLLLMILGAHELLQAHLFSLAIEAAVDETLVRVAIQMPDRAVGGIHGLVEPLWAVVHPHQHEGSDGHPMGHQDDVVNGIVCVVLKWRWATRWG